MNTKINIFSITQEKAPFLKDEILNILAEHGISKRLEAYDIIPVQGPHLEPIEHDINVFNMFLMNVGQRGYNYLMILKK
jgi:hypothetical protein